MKKLLLVVACFLAISTQAQQDNATLSSLDTKAIVKYGTQAISGTIVNSGENTIHSLKVNWQINDNAIQSESLNGLQIAPGANYSFDHNTSWEAMPGSYDLKVWVSEVNGASHNSSIVKPIQVASGGVIKYPLYEKFTSSTCGPCAYYNDVTFNAHYDAHHEEFVSINYQMNWPGAGDPYYTAEGGVRRGYYGVNGVP